MHQRENCNTIYILMARTHPTDHRRTIYKCVVTFETVTYIVVNLLKFCGS